jgi:dephospho-CoA kinase
MLIHDIITESQLEEGPNDPSIYKAVFLAGGPGSGKSYIVKRSALQALGFKIVNNDAAFEHYLAQAGMTPTPDDIYSRRGQEIRSHAKEITNKQMQTYLKGALGLVIDGTGKDFDKIKSQSEKLEDLGYDTAMVFVNTDLETALKRNRQRKRQLPDAEVKKMWDAVQKNIGSFQHQFENDMYIVDNSDGSNTEEQILRLYKRMKTWAKKIGTRRVKTD